MAQKFNNKYRIESARLPDYDYSKPGLYFVTICTHMQECYFGEIHNGEMYYSEIGELAVKFWMEIPDHFRMIQLDVFQVMPNHLHAIICITHKPNVETAGLAGSGLVETTGTMVTELAGTSDMAETVQTPESVGKVETPESGVSTTPPNNKRNQTLAASQKWKSGILGVIINQYKRAVTINARKTHSLFAWQSRYHDHIIRNKNEYYRIAHYIKNNVAKWEDDKFHK